MVRVPPPLKNDSLDLRKDFEEKQSDRSSIASDVSIELKVVDKLYKYQREQHISKLLKLDILTHFVAYPSRKWAENSPIILKIIAAREK